MQIEPKTWQQPRPTAIPSLGESEKDWVFFDLDRKIACSWASRLQVKHMCLCFDDTIDASGQMPFPSSLGQGCHIDGRCPERCHVDWQVPACQGTVESVIFDFSSLPSLPFVSTCHARSSPLPCHCPCTMPACGCSHAVPSSVLFSPLLSCSPFPSQDDRPSPGPLAHLLSPACEGISPNNSGVILLALAHVAVLLVGPLPCWFSASSTGDKVTSFDNVNGCWVRKTLTFNPESHFRNCSL